MTLPTQLVLRVLIDHPGRAMYGLEICNEAGLASGTIHPILARLETIGWLESQWEDVDPTEAGRPRRRYYQLSPDGAEQARKAIDNARTPSAAMKRLRPNLAGNGGI